MVGIFAVMIVVVNIVTTSEKFCSLYIPVKQRFDFITIMQISLEVYTTNDTVMGSVMSDTFK